MSHPLKKAYSIIVAIAVATSVTEFLPTLNASDLKGPTVAEMMDQLENDYLKSKKELERLVQAISKSIPSNDDRKKFRSLQKQWEALATKDSELRAHFTSGGGSAYSMDYLCNLLEWYESRIKSLAGIAAIPALGKGPKMPTD